MAIYEQYAPFYDLSGQARFTALLSQYLDEVLERHPAAVQRVLDVACGTGTLALILADRGWQIVGVDASVAMLACAHAKAANLEASGQVTFVQGDMRQLDQALAHARIQPGFDLVTCTYDSLNYLLIEADLAACFAGVARALRPGGLFVGDMNTRRFLEQSWRSCEVLERPGYIQIEQSFFDPATACSTLALTGFAGSDDQGYARFDEVHVERAYPPEHVHSLLETAGLQVEAAYECFTFMPANPHAVRVMWVARKPVTAP